MAKKPTVWKAQWPLSGEPFCLIYEADTRQRQSLVPATSKLWNDVFQRKYTKVFFQGRVTGGGELVIDKFVRQGEWAEDATTVKPDVKTDYSPEEFAKTVQILSREDS